MIKLEEELYFDKILGPIFITYYGKTESDEQNERRREPRHPARHITVGIEI